ncbi:MAG: riboflavin kinase / adenylyltransferase [Fusobacteriaceae bacterium]|jgi:riboflavin kinase/FMN adenylyltransferase|nr:riboflavin biosynthesis protein RibF [Fusobacteriales bacterium]MDN5304438.1 riboflavin kinase / adenylyltransferase [Fusobacteriaceae bacterium]
MEIIIGLENYKKDYKNVCLALGTFDGIHKGHKKLIKSAVECARKNDGTAVVMTFSEHPKKVFHNENRRILINNEKEKIHLLKKIGVDVLVIVHFTEEFKKLTPYEFVSEILYSKLKAKHLFAGFNYTFGAKRAGKAEDLIKMAKDFNIETTIIKPVTLDNTIISSTLIRDLIQKGEMELAEKYLGYPFLIMGEVIHGKKIGRKIGFPTANIKTYNKIYPPNGIYGVEVIVEGDNNTYDGLLNIGHNPTINENIENEYHIEVHILDFDEEIYGKEIMVKVKKYLREEIKFDTLEELIEAIKNDIIVWRNHLKVRENE